MAQCTRTRRVEVIGIDLGDKKSVYCGIDQEREVILEGSVTMTRAAFRKTFAGEPCRVVLEAGAQSAWCSEELEALGHEVIVANPRRVPLIYRDVHKDDVLDAEKLARLGLFDVALLSPIQHRGAEARADLAVIKARHGLVRCRTKLINHVRSTVKVAGCRLPSSSAEAFVKKASVDLPGELRLALEPLLETITHINQKIAECDRRIQLLCAKYPVAHALQQITGVGPLTALAFILTLEEWERFDKSRTVGAFLGLIPRRSQSGDCDPELHITKAGNGYMRQLLIISAHYILGFRGPDCDLRRYGQRILDRGGAGKRAKKRAVVAVARKLAVLLHHLWKTGDVYEPLHTANRKPGV